MSLQEKAIYAFNKFIEKYKSNMKEVLGEMYTEDDCPTMIIYPDKAQGLYKELYQSGAILVVDTVDISVHDFELFMNSVVEIEPTILEGLHIEHYSATLITVYED